MRPYEWLRRVQVDPALPSRAKHVACVLATNSTAGAPSWSRISLRQIQHLTSHDKVTVIAGLRDLTAAGWVAVERSAVPSPRGGRRYLTTTYHLVSQPTMLPVDNPPSEDSGVVEPLNQGGRATPPNLVEPLDHKKIEDQVDAAVARVEPVDSQPIGHDQVAALVARLADSKRLR